MSSSRHDSDFPCTIVLSFSVTAHWYCPSRFLSLVECEFLTLHLLRIAFVTYSSSYPNFWFRAVFLYHSKVFTPRLNVSDSTCPIDAFFSGCVTCTSCYCNAKVDDPRLSTWYFANVILIFLSYFISIYESMKC